MTAYEYLKRYGRAQADELAAKVKINPDYFSQICYGHRHPSPKTAKKLVNATGGKLTLDDLLFPPKNRAAPRK